MNARSVLPKMDQIKVWVHSSSPDLLSITDMIKKASPTQDTGRVLSNPVYCIDSL